MSASTHHALFKIICFKEWIKLRRLFVIPVLVLCAVLVDIYLRFKGVKAMHGATSLWLDLVYKQSISFGRLELAFLFTGLWLACVQFLPECSGKRLRLLFHLPVSYRFSLYSIAGIGLFFCMILFLSTFAGFWAVLKSFGFPPELISPMIQTAIPWALAGLVTYAATAAIIAEPVRFRKVCFALLGYAFISLLATKDGYASMTNSLWIYALVCLLWPFCIEAAALRVKEGK